MFVRRNIAFVLAMAFGCFVPSAIAQSASMATNNRLSSCTGTGAITVHAPASAASKLSFCDGHAIGKGSSVSDQARPLALASGDFNEDGVPDLVSGFSTGKTGFLTLHRGNFAALWPYGASLRDGHPEAFLPSAATFSLPESPDFLVTGDFDADGHWDIVAAQRGSNALYFLRGNGRGGFAAAKRIPVAGAITALISGEINRTDGLADLIVAVTTAQGSSALVYESPTGALRAQPEIFKLSKPAIAMALGRFDGSAMIDLAVASGNDLVVIHGRDRKLSLSSTERAKIAAAKVTVHHFNFELESLAAGDFTAGAPSIAVLGKDGKVHILEHSVTDKTLGAKLLANPNLEPTLQVSKPGSEEKPVILGSKMTQSKAARLEAMRKSYAARAQSPEWTERSTVAVPSGFAESQPRLIAARVSGSIAQDLLLPDSANNKIHIFSTGVTGRAKLSESEPTSPTRSSIRLLASLEATSAPTTVLPMRLNQHGLNGLVLLQAGQSAPTVMPQDVAPANTFTVTNTSDAVIHAGTQYTGPAGSLRKAMYDASQATGTSSIVFNIPTTDNGYNAKTGSFLIQPLSEAGTNADNDFALPPINNTVTIDGYTQPGASPNTLATGDNARILIQIDGGKATTPGGAGLVPFDDVGSVYRGLAFTGWTNGQITNNTESGAEGIEANGVSDFIEGNFFGTDTTGKVAAPNRIGVFADNGPGLGNTDPGNIIGGTTPQARNILSGNTLGGILFLSTAIEAQLKGNFIGLDITGSTVLPNGSDGAGLNGPTVTIGGTLPGDGNVISGNPTNVDINDITEGGAAKNSQVQGNLVGTDATGTKSPSGGKDVGVSLIAGVQDMLIGGTTPAARNIVSGNNYGVYVFDGSFNNTVQGNYIGTDVTGSKALANTVDGFATGLDTDPLVMSDDQIAAGDTALGGSVAGAGNVISGNGMNGVAIEGTSNGPTGQDTLQGNTIQGNFIGTDATGKSAISNLSNGISLTNSATNNIIGGSDPSSANLIANNGGHGILIDPEVSDGSAGYANNTIANSILSNKGAGVRVVSGTENRISKNSIFGNSALGIDIAASGPNTNTNCNTPNSGANNLQNSPVLTKGTGTLFISATATDPNGNTSEFSNVVPASGTGNMLDLMGTFNSTANTAYTIEFFSNTTADSSGFGQGQTYLGTTTVTTDGSCTAPVSDPVNTTQADVSVTLSLPGNSLVVGPDMGQNVFTANVANNGVATAHDVVLTDVLPTGIEISSAYCNVGPCQSPIITSFGSCTVSGQTVTCNIGTLTPGATTSINIPVQVTTGGTYVNTATVKATEGDPVLANNSSSVTSTPGYPFPLINNLDPTSALKNQSGGVLLSIYGSGMIPQSTVTFNGTAVPVKDVIDNQTCTDSGTGIQEFCSALQVQVPASLLTTSGAVTVEVTNPNPGEFDGEDNFPSDATFTIADSCTFTLENDIAPFGNIESDGTGLIPGDVGVTASAPSCSYTASSSVPWAVILDTHNGSEGFNGEMESNIMDNGTGTGSGTVDIAIAPNTGAARTGTVTVAGQTFTFTQDGGASCDIVPAPTSVNESVAGGNGTIAITSGCFGYYVTSYAPWITIPSSSGLLVDNATASYTVAANHDGPRTGTVNIGGVVFTVNQAAPSCYYTLSTTSNLLPVAGGTGSIGVTPSSSSCKWTAISSNASVLKVTSGATGTGNGTVGYSVPLNTGGAQTQTLTIGDSTGYSVFTLTQASAFTCTFSISPGSIEVPSNGTSNFVLLTASFGNCKWTAASSDPTALAINGTGAGQGTSAIYYSVAQNTTGKPRVLTLVAGCETFTVNQDGGATTPNNPVPAITTIQPASVAAGSGALNLIVNGSGFINGSVVNFNGTSRVTTFVSATQLTAAVLASDVTAIGSAQITVTNAAPGGGTSNAVTFTITGTTSNPVPKITTLQPSTVAAGSAAFTLTVNGSNFLSSSVVNFNGLARATTFVSATQLTASILATDVAKAGSASITVTNPTPGGGTSSAVTFTISAANNPVPAITTLAPASVAAGSKALTLTINGSGFVSGSAVSFNGAPKATTFVSATQLTAAILAADVAKAGSASITVTNPTPGGGTSNAVTFVISAAANPVPAITTLSPSSVAAASGAFTLTINGSNFVSSSVVNFNNASRITTFVSATQLTAAILATDVATAASDPVTVTNSTPGGGTSNALTFKVTAAANPVPAITKLAPASVTAGSKAFTLTITGSGFLSSSVVNFNGVAKATTFVSATQLSAAILATDVAKTGSPTVSVTNPSPGGGTSNTVVFSITTGNNPAPTITALQPASVAEGSGAFTLIVNGTNFISSSEVSINGTPRATTLVSGTQLTAAILASDITTAGSAKIAVTTPTPGGGTSNTVTLTITASNPVPTITTLLPTSVAAGSGAFTLTVNGTNFLSTSTVSFNDAARSTTFVSATKLTAAIPASDVTNAGSESITVSSPTPGGGTSNAVSFTVTAATNPVPAITALQPASVAAGSPAFTITVTGSNFGSGSHLSFNGKAAATTFVSATQLKAAISAADIATQSVVPVTVSNPAPGGGTSNALNFTITAAVVPPPTLTPSNLSFPNTVIGITTKPEIVTLSNTQSIPLAISSITLTGANPTDFAQTNTCGTSIAAGDSCTISVTFTPASAAAFKATLSVADNGLFPQTVALTGTGISASTFTVSSTTTAQTIFPGGSAQYSVTVASQNGAYSSPVTLSATGLPAGATATFAPASVTPGSSSATSQLTIQTSTTTAALANANPSHWPITVAAIPLFGLLFPLWKRKRRWVTLCLLVLGSLGALTAVTGCGGGFKLPGAPSTNYSITITGTSGDVQQSTTVQLTVK